MTYHESHAHMPAHDHDTHDHHAHDRDIHDHHAHRNWVSRIVHLLPFSHSHAAEDKIDTALEQSELGIWALKVSLVGLGATALFQIVIFLFSGSVGLLADTIHNVGDALTAVPLWVAFVLGRRGATRRYTYGFGRAEDVAGILIVLTILLSALIAGYESYRKLIDPQPISHVGWVIAAALVGFAGNELVAIYRIRVGTQIGSAALIADGQHARVDGFTSLAVLIGALGSLAGYPLVDPIIGLLITVTILVIVKDTAVTMWHRLMDAVDPAIVDRITHAAGHVPGVEVVGPVRARWVGHTLHADMHISVDADLPTHASHGIANAVRHALFQAQPRLAVAEVYIRPCGHHE